MARTRDDEATAAWKLVASRRAAEEREREEETATLPAADLLLRFLRHVLPRGFTRVHSYGLWAPTRRRLLATARANLDHHHAALGDNQPAPVERPHRPTGPRCPSCGTLYVRPLRRLPPERGPS